MVQGAVALLLGVGLGGNRDTLLLLYETKPNPAGREGELRHWSEGKTVKLDFHAFLKDAFEMLGRKDLPAGAPSLYWG
jgi:hypothetical protein